MQTPQPIQIAPDFRMTVVLEAQQWNAVMASLHREQYFIAAPLIEAMGAQLRQQAEQANATAIEPPLGGRTGNGLDHEPVEAKVA